MINRIRNIVEDQNTNAHQLSRKANLTYRIVLGLVNAEQIKPSTPIGTLLKIANALDVPLMDLFEFNRDGSAN